MKGVRLEPIVLSDLIAAVIQSLIFIGIFATCIFAYCNIRQQADFNRNMLRPWVYCVLDTSGIKPFQIYDDGRIRFNYTILNTGTTPALYVKSYSCVEPNAEFPENSIRQKIAQDMNHKSIFLFPNEKITGMSDFAYVEVDSGIVQYKVVAESIVSIETLITKSETLRTRQDVINSFITFGGLHLHIYQKYMDFDNKEYGIRTTFFVRLKGEDTDTILTAFKTFNSHLVIE